MLFKKLRRPPDPVSKDAWSVQGSVVLDLQRSSPETVAALEPHVDVRAANDWGGFMDGTMEVTDEGLVWVPSDYARRFGFDAFRLLPDEVIDIRVTPRNGGGAVDIDLTNQRRMCVTAKDVEQWQSGLDRVGLAPASEGRSTG